MARCRVGVFADCTLWCGWADTDASPGMNGSGSAWKSAAPPATPAVGGGDGALRSITKPNPPSASDVDSMPCTQKVPTPTRDRR